MKSRQRPPLNLSGPEPEMEDFEPTIFADDEPTLGGLDAPVADEPEPETAPEQPSPLMSERRRRRLAEEQRQAEERRDLEIAEPEPVVAAEFAESADQPPARVEEADKPTPPALPSPAPRISQASRATRMNGVERHAYGLAGLAALLWVGGVSAWAAYEFGIGQSAVDPLRIALYAMIAVAPVGLAFLLAHAIRQGAHLAAETRRARGLAEALVAPTALAAQQTGVVLQTLRGDIDQATLLADRARNDMNLLREALVGEAARLNEAAENAVLSARRLAENLAHERDQMHALGERLDIQSGQVLDAVERQSRMIVDASDLAQTQLREAEAAMAARAADLAAAAVEAQDAARLAADDLARQTLRLEDAGSGVAEQIQSVEEGLGQQRAALVAAAYALRTDQEDFSAQVESQRAQLIGQLDATRGAAGALDETAGRSVESLKDMVQAAGDQFRALIDMSQREADGFDAATKVALDRFEAMAAESRDTLVEETRLALAAMQATAEQTRQEAALASEQAQLRADRLGEALFDAAQKADMAADDRIKGARRVIDETAQLVDEAGDTALQRLDRTMNRMTDALHQIEQAVGQFDERTARMPEEARVRADAVRATVEDGLAALSSASRKAAEDTEHLEVAFQERVRRNYDMLTEAVRLMGVVSGEGAPAGRARPAAAAPAPTPTYTDRLSEERPEPRPARRPVEPEPGLRGRLRSDARDEEFGIRPLPAAPAAPPPVSRPAPEARTRSEEPRPTDRQPPVDRDGAAADADAMADRITDAIRRMGVDPNALLPRARIEEASRAFADGDPDRARQIVRRVAPAAVRSVSRRVMSDSDLKRDTERYVRVYSRMLQAFDGDGLAVLGALGSDAGRAFLLLDAAIGDVG